MAIRFEKKILSREQCLQAVEKGQFKRPLVFTNGVFDILHRGHVSYLDQAAQLGATLIVAVNTDESVRRLGKAPDRPLNRQEDRAALLAALSCVTAVTSFSDDTPLKLIEQLKPDIIVKGGDYEMEKLPETARVKSWGGKAIAIPFEFERSTTSLVKKIREAGQVPDADS